MGNVAMNPASLFDVLIKCSRAREIMGLWEEALGNTDEIDRGSWHAETLRTEFGTDTCR